ncbi:MAG: prepilin-type N-terminal cleavage/methylation domain-containing protein [Thermodesulfobacteriota bacterium]|nr:prepilin-type N-terminal cleavage/methylation domain-containing protein [Thermodesulfobacteriota bacterium]
MNHTQEKPMMLFNNKGFTLIEIAIVLIIIGIIIGAVVKGKDVMKSAQQKQLYTKYLKAWELTYNNYYDRTGWILGDDASDNNATRDGQCGNGGVASEGNIQGQLDMVGIDPPAQGSTGSILQRTYTDSQGIRRTLQLAFDNDTNLGNFIRIYSTNGIPYDLGMAWDRVVDGTMDGTAGNLRYTANYTAASIVTAAWPDADAASVANSAILFLLEF